MWKDLEIVHCMETKNGASNRCLHQIIGGDEEDRTLDLTDANRTLSQLSYAPKKYVSHYSTIFSFVKIAIRKNYVD